LKRGGSIGSDRRRLASLRPWHIRFEVKADLDPRRFTIRTAPTLLAKSTAWKDYCDALRPLEHAIKQLTKVNHAA
jgi:DNA primase